MQKGKRKVTVMQRKEDYKFAKMNNLHLHKNAFKLGFPLANLKKPDRSNIFKVLNKSLLPDWTRLTAQTSNRVTEALGSSNRNHLPSCFGQLFPSSLYYAPWKIGFVSFFFVCGTTSVTEYKKKSLYYRLVVFCLCPFLQSTGEQDSTKWMMANSVFCLFL